MSVVFHGFPLVSSSSVCSPATLSVTHSRDIYFAQRFFFLRGSPHEDRSPAALLQFRVVSRDWAFHSFSVVPCLTRAFFVARRFSLFTRSKKRGFEIFSVSGSPLLCPVLLLLLTLSPVLLSFSSTPPLIVFFAATPHQTVSCCFQQWEARNQVSSPPNPLFGHPRKISNLCLSTPSRWIVNCFLPRPHRSPLLSYPTLQTSAR